MDNTNMTGALNERHFEKYYDLKGHRKTWQELIDDGTVIKCRNCNKWVWAYWHKDSHSTNNKAALYDSMELCGPCFFKQSD